MKATATGLSLCAIATLVVVLSLQNCSVSGPVKPPVKSSTETDIKTQEPVTNAETEPADVDSSNSPAQRSDTPTEVAEPEQLDPVRASERAAFFNRFDLSQIGREPLDEGAFNALVAYLKNDAGLLAQFLAEYRSVNDPQRARRLAQVLDEFDSTTITTLAEELVFSGDTSSQLAGLDLLSGQQNNSPEALELVSQVLELETNPVVISSALNALATPGEVSTVRRESLLNQFVMHSSNEDPSVRRRSMALMRRWAGDANMNQHYISGLQDHDEKVRIGAVLALASTKHPDDDVYQALVAAVEDNTMDRQSRRTALNALEKQGLSETEKQRLLALLAGS